MALRGSTSRLFMWTFTFPYFASPEASREMVRRLIQHLRRKGASGVRVYEQHKSGSLHIHLVIDKYFHVNPVRHYWQSLGGGRIHCKFLSPSDAGQYITKELSKTSQRFSFKKGTRVYATFGDIWKTIGKTLVNMVRFESVDFCRFMLDRGERYTAVKTFAFGLEYFGVGYASTSEMIAAP